MNVDRVKIWLAAAVGLALSVSALFLLALPSGLAIADEGFIVGAFTVSGSLAERSSNGGSDASCDSIGNSFEPYRVSVAVEDMVAKMFGVQADADELLYTSSNGWQLSYVIADDEVTITDVVGRGSDGTLSIPSQIAGYPVTSIGERAFYNKGGSDFTATLTQVQIPNTIKVMGSGAFLACGLTSIRIPASVEFIPGKCFAACADLKEVVFEGETLGSIGDQAFNACSSLKELVIPELTSRVGAEFYSIGRACFYRCSNLETIIFKGDSNTESQRYIANSDCFDFCTNLKRLVYYCKLSTIPRGTASDSTTHIW